MTAVLTGENYPTEDLECFCRKVISVNLFPEIAESY